MCSRGRQLPDGRACLVVNRCGGEHRLAPVAGRLRQQRRRCVRSLRLDKLLLAGRPSLAASLGGWHCIPSQPHRLRGVRYLCHSLRHGTARTTASRRHGSVGAGHGGKDGGCSHQEHQSQRGELEEPFQSLIRILRILPAPSVTFVTAKCLVENRPPRP